MPALEMEEPEVNPSPSRSPAAEEELADEAEAV